MDNVTSAVLAFSVARKLRTAYSGSAIRVRRSSDDTEQDIGFVANALDTAALLAFCGAGDGFIVTRYDQSGHASAQNLTQAVASAQTQIVASGAVITRGGKPYALAGNDDFEQVAASWATRPSAAYCCYAVQSEVGSSLLSAGTINGGTYGSIGVNGDTASFKAAGQQPNLAVYVNGSLVAAAAGATRDTVHDSVSIGVPVIYRDHNINLALANWDAYRTAYSTPTSFPMFDTEAERIIITDAAEVAALESNMAAFYGVTLA
ncbi:MAG TPA: arabinofuranosidase catalytic domain-containing protein [Acidimicrobiia bacterium]